MHISLERPDQSDVLALIDALDAYQKPLYPAASHHGLDSAALAQPHVLFAVARNAAGVAAGCGAIVIEAGYGEIKRMFVAPEGRGKGTAAKILAFLEARAIERGCTRFALETGIYQPEAIALYEKFGYRRGAPFGSYAADPMSVFMRKG